MILMCALFTRWKRKWDLFTGAGRRHQLRQDENRQLSWALIPADMMTSFKSFPFLWRCWAHWRWSSRITVDQVNRYWAGSSSLDNYITGNLEMKWQDALFVLSALFMMLSSVLSPPPWTQLYNKVTWPPASHLCPPELISVTGILGEMWQSPPLSTSQQHSLLFSARFTLCGTKFGFLLHVIVSRVFNQFILFIVFGMNMWNMWNKGNDVRPQGASFIKQVVSESH